MTLDLATLYATTGQARRADLPQYEAAVPGPIPASRSHL